MTDRPTLERCLRELYDARMNGPLDRLCGVFAPQVQFRIAGTSEGKPIAIAEQGMPAVRPWLSMLVKTFRLADHQVLSLLVDGDRAAVHWSASVHSRITGTRVKTEFVDLVEFEGAQIVSYAEFFVPD
ncbi:MAG TPA: nuclear transport factor 2 family protein [Steroidobacteraceae bacterium]|jgi:ketosteroid isomerase-like protein|nr:nuclear transport factor 2 family protein [Steroidobacteraceae bacterium]